MHKHQCKTRAHGTIWYPAAIHKGALPSSYLSDRLPFVKRQLIKEGYPEILINRLLKGITSLAFNGEFPLPDLKPYPVIIFSHGLFSLRDMYTVFTEELASHGYIVVSIDHTYLNAITVFPDGHSIDSEPLLSSMFTLPFKEQSNFVARAIGEYQSDMRFVLDQLNSMNRNSACTFFNRLDINNIGILGHSAGGMAALEMCRSDDRCKAAINMDGWNDQVISVEPFQKPILLLCSQFNADGISDTVLKQTNKTREEFTNFIQALEKHQKEFCKNMGPYCKQIIFPGVDHSDFGDIIFAKWPLRNWNAAEPYATVREINTYITNFFDHYLKQRAASKE